MKKISEESGAKWVILQIPPKDEILLTDKETPSETFIREYCEKTGTLLVNPRDFLRARFQDDGPIEVKGHYTPSMNEAVAVYLRDSLEEILDDPGSVAGK
jgi:hypothetical protein